MAIPVWSALYGLAERAPNWGSLRNARYASAFFPLANPSRQAEIAPIGVQGAFVSPSCGRDAFHRVPQILLGMR